jgi:hypothetical protein
MGPDTAVCPPVPRLFFTCYSTCYFRAIGARMLKPVLREKKFEITPNELMETRIVLHDQALGKA